MKHQVFLKSQDQSWSQILGIKVTEIHMLTVERKPTSLARTDPFVTLSTPLCFLRVFPGRNIG